MDLIFTPKDYKRWSDAAIDKIIRVIGTCENEMHIETAQRMINNFIVVSALQEQIRDEDLQSISHQLWLRIKLQEHLIYLRNASEQREDWFHGWEF